MSPSALLKTQMIVLHGSSYSRIIIMGNVTRDGMISVSDVVMMSSIMSNPSSYTAEQRTAADVNFDGIFDAADTKLIRERIMNGRW